MLKNLTSLLLISMVSARILDAHDPTACRGQESSTDDYCCGDPASSCGSATMKEVISGSCGPNDEIKRFVCICSSFNPYCNPDYSEADAEADFWRYANGLMIMCAGFFPLLCIAICINICYCRDSCCFEKKQV